MATYLQQKLAVGVRCSGVAERVADELARGEDRVVDVGEVREEIGNKLAGLGRLVPAAREEASPYEFAATWVQVH